MRINKFFLKSISYSNAFFFLGLIILFFVLESRILNEIFGYDPFGIIDEIFHFIFIFILFVFSVILYFKFKYVKYNNYILYFLDFIFSFILFFIPIILFFVNYLDIVIFYIILNIILAFIFYYFKNIRVISKIKEELK